MIVFGPVPSRRLGLSLGINNIPPKTCSYSCVYCQIGRTKKMQITRENFYPPEEILSQVAQKMSYVDEAGDRIDYATFVADGEPTLDVNLGKTLDMLKQIGLKTAVISNASLVWQEEVRNALSKADWVSLKVDSVKPDVWKRIDRPYGKLDLSLILKGIKDFSQIYQGEFVTETMLLKDVNDDMESIQQVAEFLSRVNAKTSYISIPIRPPAEKNVFCPDEASINLAYQIFGEKVGRVELLTGYEGNQFSFAGGIEDSLLSITSVHPIREDGIQEMLTKAGAGWEIVNELIKRGKLREIEYNNKKFYLRKFN